MPKAKQPSTVNLSSINNVEQLESAAETKKKIKRPDKASQRKENSSKRQQTIKCSLNKRLLNKSFLSEINNWVLNTSKVINKGSLVFNQLLLHCCSNNILFPDLTDQNLYIQCFNIGIGQLNNPNPLLETVWKTYFANFPAIDKILGDIQAYVYAAKTYQTNFKNSLIYPFKGRQKNFIKQWCKWNDISEDYIYPIQAKVNNWDCKTEVPEAYQPFIDYQKEILNNTNESLTFEWLGKHMDRVVLYYDYILQFLEQFPDVKKF